MSEHLVTRFRRLEERIYFLERRLALVADAHIKYANAKIAIIRCEIADDRRARKSKPIRRKRVTR